MQIRLTLHVPRRRPRPVELVVRWRRPETVATLREALADHLGEPVEALVVDGHVLPDDHPVGVPPLLDGASAAVAVAEVARGRGAGPAGPGTVLEVVSVGGPDAGRALPLTPPGVVVGRSPAAGLRLDDPSLSRSHCRLDVGPDGVKVVDLGSTNGVEVDGARVAGAALVDTTSRMVIGATALRLRRTGPPGAPVRHPGDGTVVVSPAPAASAAPPVTELVAPRAPEPPTRARVPWVAALAPVPVVAVLAVFLGPQVLAFAVLGPVVLLATGLGDRWGSGRRHRRAVAEHADALAEHEVHVEAALAAELRWRHLRHPDPHEVGSRATRRGSGLWSGGERTVRLGLGDVAASCRVVDDRGVTAPRLVRGAPVVVDLAEAGGLGLVGPESGTRRLLAALVGQLVVRNPPSRLVVDVVGGGAEWTWLDLLPHRSTSEDDERVVLVVPDVEAPGVTARVAAVHAAGGVVLAAATVTARLPEACGAHVELVGGGRIRLSGNGADDTAVADGVGPAWADRLARALAPLREQGTSDADLPRELGLADVLGDAALTVDGVGRRWAAAERPTAVVGATATGAFRLDLATDGPHVLVGGTTGSGKSEFLRTLVTGLALDSPPEDLTLLLVDFKGGAAFGPCARLPHVVGLVTDLDDHLVRRVLTSLEAELRRREEMLAAHGCADLDDHRRSAGSGDRIPRLVVVVDELRALVDGHPEVAGALARLAAQGRSLGMHLVLATQRPAGTVTAEVQANVNLRLAFRVRDRADSHHVVEDDSAALLPVDRPGRGVSRGGDGTSTTFQAALVAPAAPDGPSLEVVAAEPGRLRAGSTGDRSAELAAVVDVVREAHAATRAAPPRRPWLPPLPAVVPAADQPAGTLALVDEPDAQRHTPWAWDPGVPLWRVVGRPRSGRSTALRALVHAAAAREAPDRLHVHVLTTDVTAWPRALPHLGTVAGVGDARAVGALLDHLAAPVGPDSPRRLLIVDGWDQLVDAEDARTALPPSERVLRLVRDGGGRGTSCAVAGGRDLLRPRWSGLGGEVMLLGPGDPLDLALLGTHAPGPGPTAGPGRGLRVRDGREVQVVDPGPPPECPVPVGGASPWTYRPLPVLVGRRDVGADPAAGWLLGVLSPDGTPWTWRPDVHGRRLVVIGPAGSGRSTALATLARSVAEGGRPVVLVGAHGPAGGTGRSGVEQLGPDDVDRLVALRTAHPDLVVLVDDADRLDDAPVRPVLEEVLDFLDRDGGAAVVAASATALASRFRGLDVTVARYGAGVLLRPRADDLALFGLPRAELAASPDDPPGRGLLVLDGRAAPLQVVVDDPSGRRDAPTGGPEVSPPRRTPRPEPAR